MRKIVVIYFSASGTTAKLAEAIHAGAAEITEVVSHRIASADIVDGRFRNEGILKLIDAADGIAFGSPTYMGGPAAQFKAFADATSDRWNEQRRKNKVAIGFTTGSCANGDPEPYAVLFHDIGRSARHALVQPRYTRWK